MLHIVMVIQFYFENNTQIPSVKVCIHFLADPVFVCVCVCVLQGRRISLFHLLPSVFKLSINLFLSL